jgi:PBP1b-binding outer membrane lipoprotein LpoB
MKNILAASIRIVSLIVLMIGLFTSCSKNNIAEQSTANVVKKTRGTTVTDERGNVITYRFYIDEVEVEAMPNPENYRIAMSSVQNTATSGTISVFGFTTNDKYANFGARTNPKLVQALLFEETMQAYAANRGLNLLEGTDFTPDQAYLDFQQKTYDDIATGKKTRGLVMLFDTYISGNGSAVAMPLTLPTMWPGWNNRVKSYTILNLAATMSMFDRWFYGKHLFTTFNWGWTNVSSFWAWNSFWDSKMSSGVSF